MFLRNTAHMCKIHDQGSGYIEPFEYRTSPVHNTVGYEYQKNPVFKWFNVV